MLPGSWKCSGLISKHRHAVLLSSYRHISAVALLVSFCENFVLLTEIAERLRKAKERKTLRRHYSVCERLGGIVCVGINPCQ